MNTHHMPITRTTFTLAMALICMLTSVSTAAGEAGSGSKSSGSVPIKRSVGGAAQKSTGIPSELASLPLVVKELPAISAGVTVDSFNRLILDGVNAEGKKATPLGWTKNGNKYVVGLRIKWIEIRADLLVWKDGTEKYAILGSGKVKDTTTGESEVTNGVAVYNLIVTSLNIPDEQSDSRSSMPEENPETASESSGGYKSFSEQMRDQKVKCEEDHGIWHDFSVGGDGAGQCERMVQRKTPSL